MILRNLVGKKKAILRIESHQTAYQTSRDWSILIVFISQCKAPLLQLVTPFLVLSLIMDMKTLLKNLLEEVSCSVCMTPFTETAAMFTQFLSSLLERNCTNECGMCRSHLHTYMRYL